MSEHRTHLLYQYTTVDSTANAALVLLIYSEKT